jgi:glycosyltransferase involved in cell wall biosynthesis
MRDVNDSVDFSIITPVFNGQKFIEETVLSVLRCSSGISFEYIVVDDGSTDKTLEILNKYDDQINIITQVNMGEAGAVNTGLKVAKGKFCLIISGDDLLINRGLFIDALTKFNENPKLAVVYPDWQIISSDGNIQQDIKVKEFSEFELLGKFICLPGPGSIFRRDFALAIGGRNTTFRFVSDYDFWLRMSEKGEFKKINGFYAQWRNHDDSTSIASRGKQMSTERVEVIYKHLMNFPKTSKLERSAKSAALYNAAILAYFSKEVPGRKLIYKAIRIGRLQIPGAKFRIVIYLLLLPVSRHLLSLLMRLHGLEKLISK